MDVSRWKNIDSFNIIAAVNKTESVLIRIICKLLAITIFPNICYCRLTLKDIKRSIPSHFRSMQPFSYESIMNVTICCQSCVCACMHGHKIYWNKGLEETKSNRKHNENKKRKKRLFVYTIYIKYSDTHY